MPRVSRFVTEFQADGKTWEAEFSHKHGVETCPHLRSDGTQHHVKQQCSHYDTKGRAQHPRLEDCSHVRLKNSCFAPRIEGFQYRIESGLDTGKYISIKHLTTCKLRYKGSLVFLSGHAPCSMSDDYNWRRGLHYALQRAMEKAGYCKLEKVGGKVVVVQKKPIYDEICEAFWREMRLRTPGCNTPARATVPDDGGPALAVIPPTSSGAMTLSTRPGIIHGMGYVEGVPVQNRQGIGYGGMD